MVDRNLLWTQRPLAAENCGAALAEMDTNTTMPENHDREVPDRIRFQYPNCLSLQ